MQKEIQPSQRAVTGLNRIISETREVGGSVRWISLSGQTTLAFPFGKNWYYVSILHFHLMSHMLMEPYAYGISLKKLDVSYEIL